MTRTRLLRLLCLLLALLVLPACTTMQRNIAATTVCLASLAADIALTIHNAPTWGPGGLLGLFVCDLSMAALSHGQGYGEGLQPQPIAKEESAQ